MYLEYTDVICLFAIEKRFLWGLAEPYAHWLIVPCLLPSGRYAPHCYAPTGEYFFLWGLQPDYESPEAAIAAAKTTIQALHAEILTDKD